MEGSRLNHDFTLSALFKRPSAPIDYKVCDVRLAQLYKPLIYLESPTQPNPATSLVVSWVLCTSKPTNSPTRCCWNMDFTISLLIIKPSYSSSQSIFTLVTSGNPGDRSYTKETAAGATHVAGSHYPFQVSSQLRDQAALLRSESRHPPKKATKRAVGA